MDICDPTLNHMIRAEVANCGWCHSARGSIAQCPMDSGVRNLTLPDQATPGLRGSGEVQPRQRSRHNPVFDTIKAGFAANIIQRKPTVANARTYLLLLSLGAHRTPPYYDIPTYS